jgi:hypothetical protein
MSTGARAAPAVDYVPDSFEAISRLRRDSQNASSVACPAVLLVGRNGSWGSAVLRSLEKCGCEFSFEAPQNVTPEFARKVTFDLILLDSTVSQEQRRELASELLGSHTSIFYTFPVENGCWWLPALRRGHDCHGAPAFRRNEFPLELERILRNHAEALAEDCFPHRVAADA